MLKRRLGRTELEVSALGFGSLGLLDRYLLRWDIKTGPAVAARLFEYVLESGINLVDTARWYDDSEERLGLIVPSRRDECVLVSKTFKRDAFGARSDVRESMRHLRTEYIDIYMVHHPQWREELEKVLEKGGALEGLRQAKRDGEIGFVGISGHDPKLLCAAIASGAFDVIEIPYNVLDHKLFQPVIDLALQYDIGVLTMKALAAGHFASEVERVDNALRFALCAGEVGSVIVGMSTEDQVLCNIRAAQQVERWTMEEREEFVNRIINVPCDYWGLDTQNYEASRCPFNVPIDEIIRLERYRVIYKNGHRSKLEYSELPVKADYCESCPGHCEIQKFNGLSIRGVLINAHQQLSEPVSEREVLQHGGQITR